MAEGCRESPSDALLTLIVPVFNEPENFPLVVADIERHVPAPFRIVMVYDFDADTTLPVAQELARTREWLELLRNDLGRGPANAIRAGFNAVPTGPALVVMSDLSDDLAVIPEMLRLYRSGYRVVCPSRYMRGGRQLGGPWLKGLMSRTAGLSLYWLGRFPTHDATNNFRLYDAALVRELRIEATRGFEIALELTAKAFAASRSPRRRRRGATARRGRRISGFSIRCRVICGGTGTRFAALRSAGRRRAGRLRTAIALMVRSVLRVGRMEGRLLPSPNLRTSSPPSGSGASPSLSPIQYGELINGGRVRLSDAIVSSAFGDDQTACRTAASTTAAAGGVPSEVGARHRRHRVQEEPRPAAADSEADELQHLRHGTIGQGDVVVQKSQYSPGT
jgi:hypothetical protein